MGNKKPGKQSAEMVKEGEETRFSKIRCTGYQKRKNNKKNKRAT
jgi:hypothetical protein